MVNKLIMALLEGDVGSRNMDKNMDNNYIDKISNKEVIRQLIIFAISIEESCKNFWMKPVSISPASFAYGNFP